LPGGLRQHPHAPDTPERVPLSLAEEADKREKSTVSSPRTVENARAFKPMDPMVRYSVNAPQRAIQAASPPGVAVKTL